MRLTCAVTRVLLTLVMLLFFGSMLRAAEPSFRIAVGYDYMSQEYFFDSLAYSGEDSLDLLTELNTTFLNDARFQIGTTLRSKRLGAWRVDGSIEQSDKYLRFRSTTSGRHKRGLWQTTWDGSLDWRYRYEGDADAGDTYVTGRGRVKLGRDLGHGTSLWGRVRSDFVQFDSTDLYSHSHWRIGGGIGITKQFANFSLLTTEFAYLGRQVADSTELNYDNLALESSYYGFYKGGNLDLYLRIEHRLYGTAEEAKDYSRIEFQGRNRVTLSGLFYGKQEVTVEGLRYNVADLANTDYLRTLTEFLVGVMPSNSWEIALGPQIDIRSSSAVDNYPTDSYREIGLLLNLDYTSYGSIFAALETSFGKRNVADDDGDLYADFTYYRVDLLGDWQLVRGLNWNLMLSSEWEWQDVENGDNRITVLSTALTYSF